MPLLSLRFLWSMSSLRKMSNREHSTRVSMTHSEDSTRQLTGIPSGHTIEMRALMYACMHLWHDWHLDIETQYQIRIPTKHGSTWQGYSDWTRFVMCLVGIRDWYWVSISRCHGCKHPPTLLSLREVRGGSKFVAVRFSEAKWSLVKKIWSN